MSKESYNEKTIVITGAAGFIGFHLSQRYLDNGWRVVGVDCLNDYYDITLKEKREAILNSHKNYRVVRAEIQDQGFLPALFLDERPELVVHLAAQAGVRYSIENPRSYLDSNIIGTFELLEACRNVTPRHLMIASTSSAYGANDIFPYHELDNSDHQMSFYAATKKSTENMAHSYSHLFGIPITAFRFFTVYGPYGRPDMALFKFTKAILENNNIDVYNFGKMKRDFTYIDDLVHGIELLASAVPPNTDRLDYSEVKGDSLSKVAPYRVVNIGNSSSVKLMDFIHALESALGKSANKNYMDIQPGDVPETIANTDLMYDLTGFRPNTHYSEGIEHFVKWYINYYSIKTPLENT